MCSNMNANGTDRQDNHHITDSGESALATADLQDVASLGPGDGDSSSGLTTVYGQVVDCSRRRTERPLHPMRKIPREILEKIFGFIMYPEDDSWPSLVGGSPSCYVQLRGGMPWILTRVCRQWKEITESYSTLWCNISINFTEILDHPVPWERSLRRLRTVLNHSKTKDISLMFSGGNSVSASVEIGIIISVLKTENERIVGLKATGEIIGSVISQLEKEALTLPRLHSVCMDFVSYEDYRAWPNFFTNCTALRRVAISYLPELDMPWERITDIALDNLHDLSVLAKLSSASTISVGSGTSIDKDDDQLPPVFVLPNLTKLEILASVDRPFPFYAFLLSRLQAPQLVTLTISGTHVDWEESMEFQPLPQTLNKLGLTIYGGLHDNVSLLQHVHQTSIRSLYLEGPMSVPALLECWRLQPSTFPGLTELSVACAGLEDFDALNKKLRQCLEKRNSLRLAGTAVEQLGWLDFYRPSQEVGATRKRHAKGRKGMTMWETALPELNVRYMGWDDVHKF